MAIRQGEAVVVSYRYPSTLLPSNCNVSGSTWPDAKVPVIFLRRATLLTWQHSPYMYPNLIMQLTPIFWQHVTFCLICLCHGTFPDKLDIFYVKKWAIFLPNFCYCCWCLIFLLSVVFLSPALMLPACLLLLASFLLLMSLLLLALLLCLYLLLLLVAFAGNPALAGISTVLEIPNIVGISAALQIWVT